MRNAMKVDGNHNPTRLRAKGAVGGRLTLPTGTARESWMRLMPSTNLGAKIGTDDRRLDIGTLRADIAPGSAIEGWEVKILNQGYFSQNVIEAADSDGNLTFTNPIPFFDQLPASAIEWVLYPELLFDWSFVLYAGSPAAVELGFAEDDAFTPTLKDYFRFIVEPYHQSLKMPIAEIDKVFYKLDTGSGETNISWGEYTLERL